jgi:hypothetical protein
VAGLAATLLALAQGDLDTPVSTSRSSMSSSPEPHNFDLFHSIRFEILIGGIVAFTAWVRSQRARDAREGRSETAPRLHRALPPRG